MFSPMSVMQEMIEDGDYSFEDDFKREAKKIACDSQFLTDEDKSKEFVRRTGVNHYHMYKPTGNLRRLLSEKAN